MSEEIINKQKEYAAGLYQQELDLLRNLLGMIVEERSALLNNDSSSLERISKEKDILLEGLLKARDLSSDAMKYLKQKVSNDRHSHLSFEEFAEEYPTEDFTSIQLLKETLQAITEKIQEETLRNEYLIKNKVSITREVIRKLQSDKGPQTYGPGGHLKTKTKKNKVTLINREV